MLLTFQPNCQTLPPHIVFKTSIPNPLDTSIVILLRLQDSEWNLADRFFIYGGGAKEEVYKAFLLVISSGRDIKEK